MLAVSVLTVLVLDLAAAAYTYGVWKEVVESAGYVMRGSFGDNLWSWAHASSFLALLTLLGFVIARRGHRVLFALPAVSFAVVPILVDLYHGTSAFLRPGLVGGFGLLASELSRLGHIGDPAEWVYWAEGAVKLAFVLVPGLLVARRVPATRSPSHLLAIGLMIVPASIVTYYSVIFLSPGGQLNSWVGAEYVAVFCLGAAMGFDRPAWPWLIAVLPALAPIGLRPLFFAFGSGYAPLIAIAGLGAITVPLSRLFQRAWSMGSATRPAPLLAE